MRTFIYNWTLLFKLTLQKMYWELKKSERLSVLDNSTSMYLYGLKSPLSNTTMIGSLLKNSLITAGGYTVDFWWKRFLELFEITISVFWKFNKRGFIPALIRRIIIKNQVCSVYQFITVSVKSLTTVNPLCRKK